MVAIIDYGVGNLFSLKSSLSFLNVETVVTNDKNVIASADKLILPGVGAFADAISKLKENGLDKILIEEAKKGKPLLGICLGMQLLFEKSFEYGQHNGLGLVKGEICPLENDLPKSFKVPQMGWNELKFKKASKLFANIKEGDYVYFVHSYYAKNCNESITSVVDYGIEVTASVECENVFGMQFHPEKSGDVGLEILKAFCEMEVK